MEDGRFKIHSICLVKNESDIIEHCLQQASEWSDYIYVYDGDSTDGTWEKVLSMKSDTIIPWKQDGKVFQESLRGEVFSAFKGRARPGDWWCHLDADEFYIESPRRFLSRVKQHIHVVWGNTVEYYLTHKDVEEIDFSQPMPEILSKLTAYRAENSEPRFFRHRDRLVWDTGSWPYHMGLVNPERILYKHFKYRSPEQIQTRLETRVHNRERGFPGWEHASQTDWRTKLVGINEANVDRKDGSFEVDHLKLPSHMGSKQKRLIKRFMHGTGIWP